MKEKIGLVIGSGGIKTLGIISLFEFLNEYQIKPDLLIGCSGGSVLSSLWASGASINELKAFVSGYQNLIKNSTLLKKIDYKTILNLNHYHLNNESEPSSLLKKDWIINFLKENMNSKRLEDCPIKIFLMTTDLKTGDPVLLKEGLMAECVYASCALYPVMPPIYLQKRWLVDGAYHSANPILEASKQKCDKIISISFEEKPLEEYGGFFEFYMNFISQTFKENAKKQNSFAIDFHHDEVLFINCYFDKNLNFWDIENLSYVNDIVSAIIEKNKNSIIDFLSFTS